ncbi:NAD-dependent epimerase/dehydratase family protein [Acholeplasma equifetale]|uniref:NAD-dependent epimerase/dehydratase family protein n=1 Tax=Acholeplasma equifetale TaxID=264634 RepID=UPI00138AEFD2|nr:NAD-dependent epimerase/dehydratase family protein [Acholeplasma equifetale]
MKKILITGANSYIGTNVEKWLLKEPDKYYVETLDMKDPNWINFDFSKFDVVFHVAGIAHIKETKKNKEFYFKVNRDLAIETAKKAKDSGVKQFIFLSTMSVYGKETGIITKTTLPNPKSAYGKSKYEAEVLLKELEDDSFRICILRPPMVYGKNAPGNFKKLVDFVVKIPLYPNYDNKRSALHIDNLCMYIKYYIDNRLSGIYCPQNPDYFNTTKLIIKINSIKNRKAVKTSILNFLIIILKINKKIRKIYGNLYYDFQESQITDLISFEDSIILSI